MPKRLLAEDDAIMVSLLKTLLKMEGFQVVAVDADADVPAAARAEQPDILLLDVYLSRQDGLAILDKIRSDTATQKLNVVMTSGMNLREECLKRGANEFLLKPYMPDDLIVVLKRTINLL